MAIKPSPMRTARRVLFGRDIEDLRRASGITRTALGDAAGLNAGATARLEEGRTNVGVDADLVSRLLDALDVADTGLRAGLTEVAPRG